MPRILLVENEGHVRDNLAKTLRALGYAVDCAHSAPSAIDHFTTVPADLVIVNIQMPRLDGWQVLRFVAGQAIVPVIVHSRLNEWEWELAKLSGATELWMKGPCSFAAMCDSLETHLEDRLNLERAVAA
jgi:DNA-binding response OmpR family regulator